ncbi:TPA: hypothetical protein ACLKPY_004638 [Klebsiella pneumoniae]
MSTTVFSLGPFRELHDLNIYTSKKRFFIANIFKDSNNYKGDLLVLDNISKNSIHHNLSRMSPLPEDIFLEQLDLIRSYLRTQGDNDFIAKIHNPCNTPFISLSDQQLIVNNQGINVTLTVN